MTDDQAPELYRKHRPKKFSQVIGQDSAIVALKGFGRDGLPHVLLLSGPSGVGKTTIARILRKMLRCFDHDFCEMNLADLRGIDEVRKIRQRVNLAPMGGECRIWLLDECHKLTNDAQNALLKLLEDTPSHVYFFLCTTDPQRLIQTIKTRATEIKLSALTDDQIGELLNQVASAEGSELEEELVDRIVQSSEGSPRKALVLLAQCIKLDGLESRLEAVNAADSARQAIELARLLFKPGAQWTDVAAVLKSVENEDPEGIRYLVLSYSRKVLLGGGKMAGRAFDIVNVFRDHLWDSKHAGLTALCWELVKGRT